MTQTLDDAGDARTIATRGRAAAATGGPSAATGRRAPRWVVDHPHDSWVALSNTTIGMLIA
ncbi:MAG: hypothetical protein ACXV1K_09525, partial [Kineosporiaceae bacterium]